MVVRMNECRAISDESVDARWADWSRVLDAEGNPVLDAAGNKKPGLLDTLIKKADGEWEGSMEAMTASGKGDGKLTLEELKRGLGDCGWMEEYLGRKVTRVEVTNSAFSGRSSFCSVM